MEKEFSTKWKGSKQPRKQRKFAVKAPLHIKKNFVSANLSKDLKTKQKKRSMPLRKGDSVKVMRGKFKGKQGKVTSVKLNTMKVTVEGLQIKKQDGSKVDVKFTPSNLQITELNMEDRKRFE